MSKENIKKTFPLLYLIFKYWKTFLFSPPFWVDYRKYKRLAKTKKMVLPHLKDITPILNEATQNTYFDTHYIYHPAWAMRILKKNNPELHIDISSTLHFCTTLSAFIPTEFYDYRPAQLNLDNLKTNYADLTNLHFKDDSLNSVSCMHTIEHIGLGRYGDIIDPEGDVKALRELQRVIKPGGNLLLVIPMGQPKIIFNAHRIYSYEQITTVFNEMRVNEFSLIPDDAIQNGMIINANPKIVNDQKYGCGCFWLIKE